MIERDHDLVVFGATSFVGRILCQRLVDRIGVDGAHRWAIAGRDPEKLARVAQDTGADVPRLVADATDPAAMARLARSARVVASTVGPYARYGSELVAAVAEAGTDYCDLTGEPQWMRAMIDAHQATAEASGARLVHACGFDSIPSDLGVWFTQGRALERWGEPCTRVGLRVKALKGGVSGGTVASMLELVDQARHDRDLRRVLADPYALAPPDQRPGPRQPEVRRPMRDDLSGAWLAPFVMGTTNSRVVHRTHALLGRPWGEDFRYDEAVLTGDGITGVAAATAVTIALGGVLAAAAVPPTRWVVDRLVPHPGEGPDAGSRAAGFYDLRLLGTTGGGRRLTTRVTGDEDPGYGSTSKMLAEAALAFADVDRDHSGGGFWTPASLFGDLLVERLVDHAGLTFEVLDAD